jgi:hypothetical protein
MLRHLELPQTIKPQQSIFLSKLNDWNEHKLEIVLKSLAGKNIVVITTTNPTERKISLSDNIITDLSPEEELLLSILTDFITHQ